MMKIHSTRIGLVVSFGLLAAFSSTAAQACDPRVTTRPDDLWGKPTYVVRDHRRPGGMYPGGVTVTSSPRSPIVRDHRAGPIIRDHRR
jgi:hypothetical protein